MTHVQTVAVDHGRPSVPDHERPPKAVTASRSFAQAEVAAEPIYSPITRECEEHGW